MVVVIGILAVLGVMGVSALVSTQKQKRAEGAKEQFLGEIQKTKFFAIETKQAEDDCSPAMWALVVKKKPDENDKILRYWYCETDETSGAWRNSESSKGSNISGKLNQDFPSEISIRNTQNDTYVSDQIALIYNVPTGKYYQVIGDLADGSDIIDNPKFESIKPTGTTTDDFEFIFNVNGTTASVTINGGTGAVK